MKNFKIIISLSFFILFSLSNNEIFAQGQGQNKQKEKVAKIKKTGKVKADKINKKIDAQLTDAEKGAQDAHGNIKNKSKEKAKEVKEMIKEKKAKHQQDQVTNQAMDSHNGKDDLGMKKKKAKKEKQEIKRKKPGKMTPNEARSRLKAKKGMVKAKINLGKEKSIAATGKIAKAKTELAKQIKEGKISEEDASRKDTAIKKAEKLLNDFNSTIEKGKKKLAEKN